MIDSHVHFWRFHPIRDSWINDDMRSIRRDFMPDDFKTATTSLSISGCVAVQASQSEAETHFLLDLALKHDFIKGIVGWVDLLNANLGERLGYFSNFPLIKGWRHVLQAESEQFILDDRLIRGLRSLGEYGYTYDLLCYHNQLPAIVKLVERLPEQPLVLDHCGKPDVKNQNLEDWKENIRILAENKHVYCKVSGLLVEADWEKWTEKEIFNCLDVIFDSFGPSRVMYGSDWPVVLVSRPYAVWFNLIKKYISRFTKAEQEAVLALNTSRFYRL